MHATHVRNNTQIAEGVVAALVPRLP